MRLARSGGGFGHRVVGELRALRSSHRARLAARRHPPFLSPLCGFFVVGPLTPQLRLRARAARRGRRVGGAARRQRWWRTMAALAAARRRRQHGRVGVTRRPISRESRGERRQRAAAARSSERFRGDSEDRDGAATAAAEKQRGRSRARTCAGIIRIARHARMRRTACRPRSAATERAARRAPAPSITDIRTVPAPASPQISSLCT